MNTGKDRDLRSEIPSNLFFNVTIDQKKLSMYADKGMIEHEGLNVALSNIINNLASISNSQKCPLEIVNPIVNYHALTNIVGRL